MPDGTVCLMALLGMRVMGGSAARVIANRATDLLGS